jgi:DNA-binding transcriptional MerR regulator
MVDYWARTGLLKPSGREAAGKGSKRRYTFQDLVSLQTISKLREGNCPLQKIRSAVRYLAVHYPDLSQSQTLARLTLLTDGKQVYVLTDQRQIMEVLTRQMVWSVPLGKLIIDANKQVEDLPQEWIEEIGVYGKTYHLTIGREPGEEDFTAHCKELPGSLARAGTPNAAVNKAKAQIKDVLAYFSRKSRAVEMDHPAARSA